jgi:hypothetical protein
MRFIFLALFFLCQGLTSSPSLGAFKIDQYDVWEIKVTNQKKYSNPFNYNEIELEGAFIAPSGRRIDFSGFYDGDGNGNPGNIWKLRFMPDEIGIWTYSYTWSDGNKGGSGSFECKKSDLHGPIRVNKNNPYWFEHADGTPFFLNAMKYIFIERLNKLDRVHLIDMLKNRHRFNAIVGPHIKSADSDGGNFDRWITDPFWDGFIDDTSCNSFSSFHQKIIRWIPYVYDNDACKYHSRLNLKFWKRMDQVIEDLGEDGIILIPFGMVGGTNSSRVSLPCSSDLQRNFARYWTYRWAAYWNVTFQPQSEYGENFDLKFGGIERICRQIEQSDPWNHLISVHSQSVAYKFSEKSWYHYYTVQNPKYNNEDKGYMYNIQSINLNRKSAKPVFFHECIWEGSKYSTMTGNDPDVIRRSAWQMVIGGGSFCYSDQVKPMHWSRHTYEVTNLPLGKSYSYIDILYDFITDRQFEKMQPHNELLSNATETGINCLADVNHEYIIFFHKGGAVNVDLSFENISTSFSAKWFDPRNGEFVTPQKKVREGEITFTAPDSKDWVLLIRKELTNGS